MFLLVLSLGYILPHKFVTTLMQILTGCLVYGFVLLITKDKMFFFLKEFIFKIMKKVKE